MKNRLFHSSNHTKNRQNRDVLAGSAGRRRSAGGVDILGMFGMSTFSEMVEPLDHVVLDAFEPKTEEEKIVSSAQKKDDQNAPSAKADRSTVVELVPASEEVLSAGKVYQQVSPSVVGIQTYEQDTYGMEQLFSSGSGIILSEDGYLLTNAHVITNLEGKASSRIEVTFPRTGEVLEAEF